MPAASARLAFADSARSGRQLRHWPPAIGATPAANRPWPDTCGGRAPRAAWAPYDTATAGVPALRASSRSCEVSPTISVSSGPTPVCENRCSSISGCGFANPSSAQRVATKCPPIPCCSSARVEATPRLAGGDRQQEPPVVELLQHLADAGKQRDLRIATDEVVPVARRQLRIAVRAAPLAPPRAARRRARDRSRAVPSTGRAPPRRCHGTPRAATPR